ncbi:hypothetical protein ACQPZX_41580 [Actinoplanes sp. CA-142083]|uniref:hypothetical protein n=1 Tax=Actinoplanes sp. CA-142083 TaxID=3239903 RepID=UPI003D8BD29E
MTVDLPPQRPEGALIHEAQQRSGRSIRQVATEAGMSDARWRQVVKGLMHVSGVSTPVVAPAPTLARMALVVGVTPQQLRDAGRDDAAEGLEMLAQAQKPGAVVRVHAGVAEGTGKAFSPSVVVADEIDLIYRSTMTATQKLDAIRKVLQLREQAEAEREQVGDSAISQPKRDRSRS